MQLVRVPPDQTVVPLPVIVQVPDPIFRVLVPVPVRLNVLIVGLLLFADKSKVPVNAPIVIEVTVGLYAAPMVTVPPPDDASSVTVSLDPGTD